MSIKSVTGPVLPQEIRKIEKRALDSSADRDPQTGGDSTPQHHKMSEEELAQALDFLKGLKGIQENNLQIRLDQHDGIVVVFIEDAFGKVIRRISETDLWTLTRDRDKSKGNIFDKAM